MNEDKTSISRRSFLDIAVGSFMSLPVLAGGAIMGPAIAHADEGGNIDYDDIDKGDQAPAKYTIIDVVRPYEVGFIAVDVTKVVKDAMGNDSFERLTGKKVHVRVISRYGSKKTAEQDTNIDGVANIDIKQLAENPDKKDVNNLDTYACNATVQVTCEGYRSFETSLMRVTGGSGLMIPLHPADAKGVWPYRASFDEWDVLYTKNQFVQSAALKDDHTLQIVARGIASTDPVTVEMLVDGEDKPRQTVKATPKKGEVTAEFKGHFLQKGDAAALPVGKVVKIVLHDREAPYAWTLALDIMEAVVDEPTSKENTRLTPFNTAGSSKPGADVKWPSGAPLVSGGSLKFWTPDLPVGLYVNPFGYAQFTLKTPSWGYKSDDGALVKGKWGQFPIKSVKDQWNGMLKDAKLMGDKTNALVSKPGSLQQLDLFKSLSLKANFQFVACAQWDNKKGLFQGEASGQILVAADFTITENFFAGPIPVLISFSLNASFVAALNAACYSATKKKDEPIIDAIMDFGRWQWDYVNSGFTMTLGLTPSLSVGVGIRGIASISVKGSITLSLFTGFKSKQVRETTKNLPNPHFTAGWSAQISLVLHLFLFTQNFVIRESKFKNFYDNWEGKDKGVLTAKSDEDDAAAALEAMSAGDLMDGMKIIADDMLRKTLDVKLNAQGIVAQSEDNAGDGGAQTETAEPIDWDAHMREEVIPLEDGTPMTYLVYDLSAVAGEKPTEGVTAAGGSTSAGGGQSGGAAPAEGEKPAGDTQSQEAPLTEDTTDTKAEGSASTAAMSAALPFSLTTKAYADTMDDMAPEPTQNAKPTTGAAGQSQTPTAQGTTGTGDMGVESTATTTTGAGDTKKDSTTTMSGQEGELGYQETQASELGEAQRPEQDAQQQSLEAQSDTSDEADGEWLGGMADNSKTTLDVAGLGTYGGVRPTADTKIFSNVFGDPRTKVVSIESVIQNKALKLDLSIKATLSFRIASVQLANGKVRTRVVANVIDGTDRGLSRVIEFETKAGAGIDHADLYDCDFDLDVINFTQKTSDGIFSLDMLCIALVSGRRKEGDGTKLADAATDLVFSCHVFRLMDILGYDIDGKRLPNVTSVVRPPAGNSSFSMRGTRITGDDKNYVHSISSLQVVREGTNVSDVKWIVSFLDRRAKDPKDVLGNESGKIDIRLGVAVWNFSKNTFSPISTESTRQKLGDINDLSVFEHVLYPKIGNEYTLMLRGSDMAYYYLMGFGLDNGTITSAKACAAYDSTTRLTYWTGNNAFLVPYPKDKSQLQKSPSERDYSSWTLHKATWGSGNKPELQMIPVGPADFNISAFALNQAGTFMFWPQAREADVDRVFNAEGTPDERELDPSYHIMACRLWKGVFSDPFIVADLAHDTDVLAVLKTDHGAAVEMLGTEFVKGSEGLYTAANIWHTMVPGVRCATVVGCEAVSAFVNPGAKAIFHVALRNDGNTFLKGCKLTLCAKRDDSNDFEKVESASTTVTFSKDTIQESNWNQMVNGKLTNIEPDYALAPGKTSVYAVSVTIPADWHGEKKVLFVASEPTKASEDKVDGITLQAQADDDVVEVEYSVEPGSYQVIQRRTAPDDDYGQRYMETIDVELASDEETFWQAPVTTPANGDGDDAGGSGSGGGNSVGGGGGGGEASASRSALPRTDDPTSDVLPLGIAAAGAGLVAYSRRRKRLGN